MREAIVSERSLVMRLALVHELLRNGVPVGLVARGVGSRVEAQSLWRRGLNHKRGQAEQSRVEALGRVVRFAGRCLRRVERALSPHAANRERRTRQLALMVL